MAGAPASPGKVCDIDKDMKQKNVCLQTRHDAKERAIGQTSMAEESEIYMDGWLNVSMFDWDKLFVVVSLHHVTFFKSIEEQQKSMPVLVLDIVSISDVRSVRWDEVHELKTKDVSRKFVLVFDRAGEKVHGPFLHEKKKHSGFHISIHDIGNLFIKEQHRCDAGEKSMLSTAKPAAECTTNDADKFNSGKLLLEADTPKAKDAWVNHITEKISESNLRKRLSWTRDPVEA